MSTLKERLREFMDATGWDQARLVQEARVVTQSAVSQWLGGGSKEIKSIGNIEAAIYIERASGWSALWLAKGVGPKMVQSSAGGVSEPAAVYRMGVWPSSTLLARLGRLPANELARIETVVEAMVSACEASGSANRAA